MTSAATDALKLALSLVAALEDADIDDQGFVVGHEVYTAAEIRSVLQRGLDSLRQQPGVLDDLQLHARLSREIKLKGSAAAAARDWGVTRQTVHDALSGNRPCPPAILSKIGLRRLPAGRALYREI